MKKGLSMYDKIFGNVLYTFETEEDLEAAWDFWEDSCYEENEFEYLLTIHNVKFYYSL